MVLVDTSVWIAFLSGRPSPEATVLTELIEQEKSIAFTGIILQELLQGCVLKRDADRIEDRFEPFIEIFPRRTTSRRAAKIYRDCRQQGFTIRSSIDCLIAACAIETSSTVLHKDRDFNYIQQVTDLRMYTRSSS